MEFVRERFKVKKIAESSHNRLPLQFGFPDITAQDLKRLKRWYWHEALNEDPALAFVQMYWHSYVLELNGKNYLIDACCGNDKDRPHEFFHHLNTPFLRNFAAQGLRPEDIDYVLCTHLHHDHVGWNTKLENGKWVPTFPKAKYVFTKTDYDYFGNYHGHDPMQNPAYADSILPIAEHGQAELVDNNYVIEHELSNGVWLEGVPGHTPGTVVIHAGPRAQSEVIFTGDVFHHPLEIVHPSSRFGADENSELGTESRLKFLKKHADTGTVLFPAHFFAGTVQSEEDTYRYNTVSAEGHSLDYSKHI